MITLPPVRPGDAIRVSASTYIAYLQCPDSVLARYRGEYGPESRASFRGGLAHRLFARHLNEGPIAPERFEQTCREEIGASSLNHKLAAMRLKPSELSGIVAEAQALYERFRSFPSDGFEGAEIAIEHDAGTEVELVGSIDARFDDHDGVRLVDWKTGNLGEPLPQLRFYALLWALERRRLPDIVEAVSIRTGERLRETPTTAIAQETADNVAALVDAVRTAWEREVSLPRQGGPSCRFCPMLDRCEEGAAATYVLDERSRAVTIVEAPTPVGLTPGRSASVGDQHPEAVG